MQMQILVMVGVSRNIVNVDFIHYELESNIYA